ncbi:site-2 protease family protein [Thermaerobacillus caldiproteolyticus]|uniref:site-2 protease family protein n=1 Tax=Thermaerobacillus caldiproteolyticus TaxID=247480 RepID=UPI00188CB415|nr:site-2 protease family protein [Anoxybacillus caldiproteolyticus]QPA30223.1 site-2 protease family protein [Anoxybacillus caldiproteolyticus]
MNKYVSVLTKIHIHPLLWLMSGIAVVTAHFQQLFLLFFIVFIHELGHAVAALFFSWRLKQILLLPFGGVAEVEEHGNRPFHEELVVTLAGPVQHIWLLGAAFLLWKSGMITTEGWRMFVHDNIAVLLINLLPIWPLDGGKLLFLALARHLPFSEAHEKMVFCSFGVLAILVIAIVFIEPSQLDLWVIVLFLMVSLWKEWRHRHYVVMRFLLERYYGKRGDYMKLQPITVDETEPILHVLQKFYRGQKHSIVVVKNNKKQATLDENELLHAFFTERQTDEQVGNLIYNI